MTRARPESRCHLSNGTGRGSYVGWPRFQSMMPDTRRFRAMKVRDGESDPPFEERPGPDKSGSHAGDGPATLDQVHGHQPDENKADDGVVGDPYVQKLQRAECGRCRAQQTEMDLPTGSSAPRSTAV